MPTAEPAKKKRPPFAALAIGLVVTLGMCATMGESEPDASASRAEDDDGGRDRGDRDRDRSEPDDEPEPASEPAPQAPPAVAAAPTPAAEEAPTGCRAGGVIACQCANGADGVIVCEEGQWSPCRCDAPAPVAACQVGQFSPCACPDGSQGVIGCSGGQWGPCQCTGAPAPAPAPAPAAVDVNAKGIPRIPRTRSNPPTAEEWRNALAVNTANVHSHPPGCSLRVVREWLHVNCSGDIRRISDMTGFGQRGLDYFDDVRLGSSASFVVRLRPVAKQWLRIWRGNDRATLFVSWMPQRDRPDNIALQICTPALACWNR